MMIPNYAGLKGRCKVSVIERGQVVREYPAVSNLILNQGLDAIATTRLADCWSYAAAGTGSTATEVDGGSETATVATGTLTISTVGFLAGDSTDVGKNIKLTSSGQVYLITGSISTTQCGVTPALSDGPSVFVVYNTNQAGLTAESTGLAGASKRTATYLTGAPYCQTVTTGSTTQMTRTFDFAAETGGITYNEVGFAATVTVGSNLFSRVKLPSGVPLTLGQQLRVEYSVSVQVSPTSPLTFATSPVANWPTGTGTLQHCTVPFAYVTTSGATTTAQNSVDSKWYAGIEPSTVATGMEISTSSTAFTTYPAFVAPDTTNAVTPSKSVYVAGSYTIDHFITYPVGQVNGSTWRSFESYKFSTGYFTGERFLFDVAQTKLSTHTLTLGFRWTWGRVL